MMDQTEFDRLVWPVRDRAYRLARQMMGDGAEAEDVVQDLYERLWLRRGEMDRWDDPVAFVMASLHNLCCDRLRSSRLHAGKLEAIGRGMSPRDPGVEIDREDLTGLARRLIGQLPRMQRTVIHLRDVEGYEIGEIARIVDAEETAVRMTLSRARKTVREQMIKWMNHGV